MALCGIKIWLYRTSRTDSTRRTTPCSRHIPSWLGGLGLPSLRVPEFRPAGSSSMNRPARSSPRARAGRRSTSRWASTAPPASIRWERGGSATGLSAAAPRAELADLAAGQGAMARESDGDPNAEYICWQYAAWRLAPWCIESAHARGRDAAGELESGRYANWTARVGGDYWLSFVGLGAVRSDRRAGGRPARRPCPRSSR
jgi:hypothetical protein